MATVKYERRVSKHGTGKPTIPPSPAHDLGDWIATDIYEAELYFDLATKTLYTRKGDSIVSISGKSVLGPALDFVDGVASNPPLVADGNIYVITNETGDPVMDVDRIEYQAGTLHGVRYYFNSFAMMTSGAVAVGDFFHASGSMNPKHNGTFAITSFNTGAGWIQINNTEVTDAGDDEATDSPATAYFTKEAWDGAKLNDVVEYQATSGTWIATTPVAGQLIVNVATDNVLTFSGSAWAGVTASVPPASETVAGVAEIATNAETAAGTDDERIVSPLKLSTWWTTVRAAAATITGVWTFIGNKLKIENPDNAYQTTLNTSTTGDNTWVIPDEGNQTFASQDYVDDLLDFYQLQDDTLDSIAALTVESGRLLYTTGVDTFAQDVYRVFSDEALTATVTWTGTTAPSGATNHRLAFKRVGKQVFFNIKLNYATAGTALTNVTLTGLFGTSAGQLPVPYQYNGWTGASVLCQRIMSSFVSTVNTGASGQAVNGNIARNAGDTDFEIRCIAFSSANHRYAEFTGMYFTD